MDTGRARILTGSALLMSLLTTAFAPPAAAADCTLTAPAYVNVGTPISIEGAGFPASVDVDISLEIEGGPSDEFLVQSDASGAIQLVLTPEDIDVGVTTLAATAGSACMAEVTYTVLAAGATPPPATPEPTDSGETGAEPQAPLTDVDIAGGPEPFSSTWWAVALILVALGLAGRLITRPDGR